MGQLDLVSSRRILRGQPHHVRALTISIGFHGLLIATIFGLGYLYHPPLLILHNGSASGAPVISLQTMVIVAPPAPRAPPTPVVIPMPPTTSQAIKVAPVVAGISAPQSAQPVASHAQPLPDTGVPVLAGPTTKTIPTTPAKTGSPSPKVAATEPTASGTAHLRPAGANFVSSYAPGASTFPHPPYPPEARDLQQTGIVRMMIRFDTKGDVVEAEVAKSSGVALLDTATRSYIQTHWHSQAFAGQAVSVPVEYTLTSL